MTRVGARRPWLACCFALLGVSGCGGGSAGAPASATVSTSPGSGSRGATNARALSLARDVWSALDRTNNTCEDLFDYHPTGGIRIFACHVFSLTSYEQIVAVSGIQPFVSGPHAQGLDLTSSRDFGHYDPAFVRFVTDHAIPAAEDATFRAATQGHYDHYVRPLARILHATHEKLAQNPGCADAELADYTQAIGSGRTRDYVEPWYYFMNAQYCDHRRADYDYFSNTSDGEPDGGYDGNVTKTAVGFWLRRRMDGTDQLFFEALVRLMNAYERPAH